MRVCILKIISDFAESNDMSFIKELIIWSDGPSCEFCNIFITGALLFEIMGLLQIPCTWKYFAPSHGKGVCDGIGGALKARVAEHARGSHNKEKTIQGYHDFFEVANGICKKVTLFEISQEEVTRRTEDEGPWKGALEITGISSVYVATCGLNGIIRGYKLPGQEQVQPISYGEPLPVEKRGTKRKQKFQRKTPTGGYVKRKLDLPKLIMSSGSEDDEDQEEFLCDDPEDKEEPAAAASTHPSKDKSDLLRVLFVPLVPGSYYLIKLNENGTNNIAVGKLTSEEDDVLLVQFFKSIPLTEKLHFMPWLEPEPVPKAQFVCLCPLPSMPERSSKIIFKAGELPGSDLR